MAKGRATPGAYGYPNPYNETGTGEEPDNSGQGIYFGGMDEILNFHLAQTGPMEETPNSLSGKGTLGGPAPGEPNPAKMGD